MSTSEQPASIWGQFSLRTLFVATAFVAVFFAWREWRCGPGRQQATLLAVLEQSALHVRLVSPCATWVPFEPDPPPTWEQTWLGIPEAMNVEAVLVWEATPSSGTWQAIATLQPREVIFHGTRITPEVVRRLAEIPHLTRVEFYYCHLTPRELAALADVRDLRELQIEDTPPELIPSYASLTRCRELRDLMISGGFLTDACVASLSGCQQLEKLRLFGNLGRTASCLKHLYDLPKLKQIDVDVALDDRSLDSLARLPLLEIIGSHLTLENVSDSGILAISRCKVYNVSIRSGSVGDEGISALAAAGTLEEVDLRGIPITDASLRSLGKLPHLRTLYLEDVPITGAGLAHLRGLDRLVGLGVKGTRVTRAGLTTFAEQCGMKVDGDAAFFASR